MLTCRPPWSVAAQRTTSSTEFVAMPGTVGQKNVRPVTAPPASCSPSTEFLRAIIRVRTMGRRSIS